jgi:hypothetical protein
LGFDLDVLVDVGGFYSMLRIQNEREIMYRGYTFLWRKIWSNAVLAEPGKRFSLLEAWLYITNPLAAGMGDPDAGLKRSAIITRAVRPRCQSIQSYILKGVFRGGSVTVIGSLYLSDRPTLQDLVEAQRRFP